MKKIRTGNDIHIIWTITKNDAVAESSDPLDLSGAEVLLVDALKHAATFDYVINTIDDSTAQVVGTFFGKDQHTQGKYNLLLVKNRGEENMITLDYVDAFLLTCVSKFGVISGNDESSITTATIELDSDFVSYNGSPDMTLYYTKDEIDEMFSGVDTELAKKANRTYVDAEIQSVWGWVEGINEDLQELDIKVDTNNSNAVHKSGEEEIFGDKYFYGHLMADSILYNGDELQDLLDDKANEDDVYNKAEIDAEFSTVNNAITAHTSDTTIHVTTADKTNWNAKQNALSYYFENSSDSILGLYRHAGVEKTINNTTIALNGIAGTSSTSGTMIGTMMLDIPNRLGITNMIDNTGIHLIYTVGQADTKLDVNSNGVVVTTPTGKTFTYNGNEVATKTDIPTSLSQLSDDATHRLVTDTEKTTWNGKQNALSYYSENTISSNIGLYKHGAIEKVIGTNIAFCGVGGASVSGSPMVGGMVLAAADGGAYYNGIDGAGNVEVSFRNLQGQLSCGMKVNKGGSVSITTNNNKSFTYNGNEVATVDQVETYCLDELYHQTTTSVVIDGVTYYYDPDLVICRGQKLKANASFSGTFVALAAINNGTMTVVQETLGQLLEFEWEAVSDVTVLVYSAGTVNDPYFGIKVWDTVESLSEKSDKAVTSSTSNLKIEVVNAMPQTPDANTIYIVV